MRSKLAAAITVLAAIPLIAGAAAPTSFDFSSGQVDVAGLINATRSQSAAAQPAAGSTGPGSIPGITEQVSAEMLPSMPKPGDTVSIRVTSYTTDLDKAYVVWTQDGRTISEGVGFRKITITAPEVGERTEVVMAARKEEGGIVTKSFTITPADLSVIYEVETYTPPFYEGRPDFTNSSRVRLVALPEFVNPDTGATISPEDLVYTWRINGKVDQDMSGQGKFTAYASGVLVSRGLQIEVVVEAIQSTLKARSILEIEDKAPEVVIYEDHPLYGVLFEKALGASPYPVRESEISLVAIPYSMDIETLVDPRVKFTWSSLSGKGEGPTAIFSNTNGDEGVFPVRTRISHANFAQYADASGEIELFKVSTSTPAGSQTF